MKYRAFAAIGLLSSVLLGEASAVDDATERILQLSRVPGISGYEADVRKAVAAMLPAGAKPETDGLGNLILRIGTGSPKTLVTAPLDEPGYVVSGITDEGYLRLHRHTPGAVHPLHHEYFVGQPVLVRTSEGSYVTGVTATPSTHLRNTRPAAADSSPRTIEDLYVDIGAASPGEVTARGVRVLDAVSLRERATRVGDSEVAGVAASSRAGAAALLEIANRSASAKPQGSVVLAWTVQSYFGQRGLLRLVDSEKPDRLIAITGALQPRKDEIGSSGLNDGGPLVREGDALVSSAAEAVEVRLQKRSNAELPFAAPRGLDTHVLAVPSRYAQTPVETVSAKDVEMVARVVAQAAGLGPLSAPKSIAPGLEPPTVTFAEAELRALARLVRAYGVSTQEEPVRAEVLRQLPKWAKPEVDKRGNIIVRFGKGGNKILFVAHTDEVGFEIASVADDGTASVRVRGGMYSSLYEAHPVMVHTNAGPRAALMAPRRGYPTSTTLEPEPSALFLDTGARSKAQFEAMGFAVGQTITPRKDLAKLGAHRATARSMDDRNGSTALLLALSRIDPATMKNSVTFAWSVEEETGLAGAAFIAESERFDTVFAVDTFVSSDTPVDGRRIAYAPLGKGAVLRGLDNRTLVPANIVDRIATLAKESAIPLQIGLTGGGTDAAPFSETGAVDVGLSWPGRYSHSPVEVMDRRDLEALIRLVVVLAQRY